MIRSRILSSRSNWLWNSSAVVVTRGSGSTSIGCVPLQPSVETRIRYVPGTTSGPSGAPPNAEGWRRSQTKRFRPALKKVLSSLKKGASGRAITEGSLGSSWLENVRMTSPAPSRISRVTSPSGASANQV